MKLSAKTFILIPFRVGQMAQVVGFKWGPRKCKSRKWGTLFKLSIAWVPLLI